MTETAATVIEKIRTDLASDEDLASMTRGLTFADAMRLGSAYTVQGHNWAVGRTACALSAVSLAARGTGWIK